MRNVRKSMNATKTCSELHEAPAGSIVVIDVMTPEDYGACHIVGAKNACIYEMVFLDKIAESVAGFDTELVVYDATGRTMAAEVAREKLIQAGYANVFILEGGLSAWRSSGLPVETAEQPGVAPAELHDGTYRIDVEKSALEWIGRNLNNRHHGRINIRKGELVVSNGLLSTGSIVLDMTTITNLDLQDQYWSNLLLAHLKSEDFFAVQRFPNASFRLTGWQPQEGGSSEAPSGIADGELTIRDVTRLISFPAIVAPQQDGAIKAHAVIDIDRTIWNVCYGSGKLFERLGMHLVHDIISLELFILARH